MTSREDMRQGTTGGLYAQWARPHLAEGGARAVGALRAHEDQEVVQDVLVYLTNA